jgi:DNA processing protein
MGKPRENRGLLGLAVQRLSFLRPGEKRRLAAALDGEAGLSALSISDLERIAGRRLPDRRFLPGALLGEAERDALLLERLGASFVSIDEEAYPAALREIPGAPFGLYLRGEALPPDRPALAVVGTRYPTPAGLRAALGLAADCALSGLPVISGLARGIDSAAHRGALSRRGFTCAVLPCGIESVYPAGNRALASAILEAGGLLLSEYPPGTEIYRSRFPERNRIISGLARGTLVVEAPTGSGALITADFALEQGRDVFVAAACLGGPRSAGLDRLAAEGAPCLSGFPDLAEDWELAGDRRPEAAPESEGESQGLFLAASLRAELSLGPELASGAGLARGAGEA